MSDVSVILRASLSKEPEYSGCENEVGTGVQACPLAEDPDVQKIIDVRFTEVGGGEIDDSVVPEEVELVVETLNMEGEDVVIDFGDATDQYSYDGEVIAKDKLLKVAIGSSEERVKLGLQPTPEEWADPFGVCDANPSVPSANADTRVQLLVTAVQGPDWTELEADGRYEFSVGSFNRDYLPEEAGAVKWAWKIPGGNIQPCVGGQYSLQSGYPAIELSWNPNFIGKEVIVMAYMNSPTEDVSVSRWIRDVSYVESVSEVTEQLTFLLNSEPLSELSGLGVSYEAFSGMGELVNKPSDVCVAGEGAIPPGTYYVVDRPSGGRKEALYDWWGAENPKADWFALFADDGTIDDNTLCNHVRRGEFRLHPKGPLGISQGCITLESLDDFNKLRDLLKSQTPCAVAGTSLTAYAKIIVT